jgi:multiple sugar transport system permease protein
MRGRRKRYLLFIALVAPALLLRMATAAYPILQTICLSFTNTHAIDQTHAFVGLENYRILLQDPEFRDTLGFTLFFILASTVLEVVAGLGAALFLNARFRGRIAARIINLVPWAIPTIVAALGFQWLLDDQSGMFSHWIFKLTGERPAPLNSVWGARISLIIVNVWKNAPFLTVVFLAGLQGVPEELYEAAQVDGANAWRRFWSITLPMIMPLLITMAMYFIVWQLASFDLIYGLTRGGPGVATNVLAHEIYRQAFVHFKFGFASSISVCLMAMVTVVGLLGVVCFRRAELR